MAKRDMNKIIQETRENNTIPHYYLLGGEEWWQLYQSKNGVNDAYAFGFAMGVRSEKNKNKRNKKAV